MEVEVETVYRVEVMLQPAGMEGLGARLDFKPPSPGQPSALNIRLPIGLTHVSVNGVLYPVPTD